MRMQILGLLAFCVAGLERAQGQSGHYQEPLPIQAPGMGYPSVPQAPAGPSRFPHFGPVPTMYMQPPIVYVPQAPVYYQRPMGYPPPQGRMPQGRMPQGMMMPRWPQPAQGYLPPGVMPVAAQDKLHAPVFKVPAPTPLDPPVTIPDIKDTPPRDNGIGANLPKEEMVTEGPASELCVGNDCPAKVDPPEPYMVGAESDWKAHKGYVFYASADYLYWWLRGQPLSPNLMLSIVGGATITDLEGQESHGGRFLLGAWVDNKHTWAAEVGGFFLGEKDQTSNLEFPGSNLANRPIFQGIASETSEIAGTTNLWSAEANLRHQACTFQCFKGGSGYLDLLGGFRFLDLSENLTIRGTTVFATAPVLLSNATITTIDSFGTHNHLYAGQIGAETGMSWGKFNMNAWTKIALGQNRQNVNIGGRTQVSAPTPLGSFSVNGGFFAQPSNIGRYRQDVFAYMPEAGINLGYKICDNVRVSFGYNFLYFLNAVRPGDQIDPTAGGGGRPALFFLGGTQPMPAFTEFRETDFWAQGVNVGIEFNF